MLAELALAATSILLYKKTHLKSLLVMAPLFLLSLVWKWTWVPLALALVFLLFESRKPLNKAEAKK